MHFRPLFLSLFLATLFINPGYTRTVHGPLLGNWQTLRHTLDDSQFSCQAIQCASGNCSNNRSFLIFATSGREYLVPQFNNGIKVAPGAKVKMTIRGKSFTLINRNDKSDKFMSPDDRRTLDGIIGELKTLERSSGSRKFFVVDTGGRKQSFSARGVASVFSEFSKQCGTAVP